MNHSKPATAHKFVLASGIVILTLGIIHSSLLYWEYNNIKTEMSPKMLTNYMAWFFILGLYLKFLGIIDLLSVRALKMHKKLAWNYALASSIFKIIGTLIALYILKWELGPPYLALIMGIVCFIPLFKQRKLFIN